MRFEKWCSEKVDRDISFTHIEKLIGVLQEEPLLNHTIVLVKKRIYFRRSNEKLPDLEDLLAYIESVKNFERYNAKLTMAFGRFAEKWYEAE